MCSPIFDFQQLPTNFFHKILAVLAQMDRFKSRLSEVPQTPRPTADADAVGALLDICVQRSWPIAKYTQPFF